jgi:hypothetical protein
MINRDERVREIAYFLWLDGGSPEGEAERHWLAAEGLVEPEAVEGEYRRRRLGRAQKSSTLDNGDGEVGPSSNRILETLLFGIRAFPLDPGLIRG